MESRDEKWIVFVKAKTAYELMPILVGSERCIGDRPTRARYAPGPTDELVVGVTSPTLRRQRCTNAMTAQRE